MSSIDEVQVDARGLNCPLPLLKLRKALATRPGAGRYVLFATDPDSEPDIRKLAAQHELALQVDYAADGALRFELTHAA